MGVCKSLVCLVYLPDECLHPCGFCDDGVAVIVRVVPFLEGVPHSTNGSGPWVLLVGAAAPKNPKMEPRWIITLFALVGFVAARAQLPRLDHGSYEMLFSHENDKTGTKVPLIPSNTLFPEVEAPELSRSGPRRKEEKGTSTTMDSREKTTTSAEVTTIDPDFTTKEPLCMDFDENCEKMAPLCENPLYHIMTTKKCAKTCNKCEEFFKLPYPMRCKDILKTCSDRMCDSDFYDLVYKRQKCAKTCGFC
ncbi:unnamed protein product, partial [Mesorhabditis belari]|uniref:ShKT domain-containing protein n=1 Tax=Mesorhabditis belari TaxID=2138241 RepID=A0AAF3EXW3_9BILA